MTFVPDGRLFVLEQVGNVDLVRADGTIWTALHPERRFRRRAGGLLGIAFDPNYATNHFVYIYYTNPNPGAAPWATGEHNQLSRFTVNDSNPRQPVFTDEAPILDWNNLSDATNHNGGGIHFGIDGMLYADAGDNVQTFTQGGNTYRVSQSLGTLLGKQLRINVAAFNAGTATRDDTTVGHLIPSNNPFVGQATGINQLIYALGLRNPFTFAVQPGTGTIFINDVGEVTWEEIDQRALRGPTTAGAAATPTDSVRRRPGRACTTTRFSPTTTRAVLRGAALRSSAATSTTPPQFAFRVASSGSTSIPISRPAGSASSIPLTPELPPIPIPRFAAFALNDAGNVRDVAGSARLET